MIDTIPIHSIEFEWADDSTESIPAIIRPEFEYKVDDIITIKDITDPKVNYTVHVVKVEKIIEAWITGVQKLKVLIEKVNIH